MAFLCSQQRPMQKRHSKTAHLLYGIFSNSLSFRNRQKPLVLSPRKNHNMTKHRARGEEHMHQRKQIGNMQLCTQFNRKINIQRKRGSGPGTAAGSGGDVYEAYKQGAALAEGRLAKNRVRLRTAARKRRFPISCQAEKLQRVAV